MWLQYLYVSQSGTELESTLCLSIAFLVKNVKSEHLDFKKSPAAQEAGASPQTPVFTLS